MEPERILVLNAGSSSLKFRLYARSAGRAWQAADGGAIEGTGVTDAVEQIAGRLPAMLAGAALAGVGHRVVHGGPRRTAPARVTPPLLAELQALVPLAPLHQPASLAAIAILAARLPGVPQVACFDTAFHRGHPPVASLVPLPARIREAGVQRYGFHGLSYEYIASALPAVAPQMAGGKVIVAHLGNGASLCALRDRRSVDSSFGFTPLDGLCMGTRPGALDPGVVLHLFQGLGLSVPEVENMLYKESGLLGISGMSSDMRDLLASPSPAAKLAVDYFIYRAAREIGALASVLGGLDGLVFTAGIGENSAEIRSRIVAAVSWLGLELDAAANASGGPRISAPGSRIPAWVIPTDEEQVIARHTVATLELESA